MKDLQIHMGLFDFAVNFIVGPDDKKVYKYLGETWGDKTVAASNFNEGYTARGRCYFRKGWVPIIWLPRYPKTPREHATLSHECIHAVWHLFEWASLPMTRDNEEVLAHATSHLINGFLKKWGRKSK